MKEVQMKKIIIGSDTHGKKLAEILAAFLTEKGYETEMTEGDMDCIDAATDTAKRVLADDGNLGIVVDAYGAAPFMAATKIKHMVAAEVSDERTAYMTRQHNRARMITIGADITGPEVAKNIALNFVQASYDGGRHQIRVDMLDKMC